MNYFGVELLRSSYIVCVVIFILIDEFYDSVYYFLKCFYGNRLF